MQEGLTVGFGLGLGNWRRICRCSGCFVMGHREKGQCDDLEDGRIKMEPELSWVKREIFLISVGDGEGWLLAFLSLPHL